MVPVRRRYALTDRETRPSTCPRGPMIAGALAVDRDRGFAGRVSRDQALGVLVLAVFARTVWAQFILFDDANPD